MTRKITFGTQIYAKSWKAFLPIGKINKTDEAPSADVVWLMSRGIESEALSVFRHIKNDLIPLIKDLKQRRLLKAFHFLIHDRTSGVPTSAEDSSAYIDLSLFFTKSINLKSYIGWKWCFVKRRPKEKHTAEEKIGMTILNAQANWYLDTIDSFLNKNGKKDDLEVLRSLRQHLHYFANMAQMNIG